MPSCAANTIETTITAATKLKDAGILVGVVGFGTEATSQNNKANLDKIANAGGTGTAFSAKDRAELAAVLAQIAGSASNCCRDACTAGATQCNGSGTKQTCQMNAAVGCTNWVNSTCSDGTSCSGGSCQPCQNTCSPGATRCSGNGVQTCEKTITGCYKWSTTDSCATNTTCSNGTCVGCGAAVCTDGAKRCAASGVIEECRNDATGCLSWSQIAQCNTASGGACQNGSCVGACTDACAEGEASCVSGRPQVCTRGSNGCTAWKTGAACKGDTVCAEGGCRSHCANDELSTCPDGQSCELVGSTRLCVPIAAPDAGAAQTGPSDSPTVSGSADGGITGKSSPSGIEGVGGSTGCTTSPGSLSLLWVLIAAIAPALRRLSAAFIEP